MTERGLNLEAIERFGLGYSGETEPGHSMFQGRLVIPYLRRLMDSWSVIGLKFRRIGDDGGAKYLGDASPHLYNTIDAVDNDHEIAICEGELDALTASVAGIPAVGVPGTETWQPFFTPIFLGYERVWLFADGDKPGTDFMKRLSRLIGRSARIVPMPDGSDVNRFVRDHGPDALREMIGR